MNGVKQISFVVEQYPSFKKLKIMFNFKFIIWSQEERHIHLMCLPIQPKQMSIDTHIVI